jgi:hypothetical protein
VLGATCRLLVARRLLLLVRDQQRVQVVQLLREAQLLLHQQHLRQRGYVGGRARAHAARKQLLLLLRCAIRAERAAAAAAAGARTCVTGATAGRRQTTTIDALRLCRLALCWCCCP